MKRLGMSLFMLMWILGAVQATGSLEKETGETGTATVTILTTAVTQNPEGPLAAEYIAAFEKQNPDIKIEVAGVPMNQALQKITTLAAAGSLPDLFVNTENNVGKLYDMGICEDLSGYMTKEELDNIIPSIRNGCTLDKRFVLYPWYSGPNALIYRKDWLIETGLQPPKTLEEMRNVAKALNKDTNSDGTIDRYGFGMIGTADDSGETRFVMILRSFGVRELYQENGKWKTEVGIPESVEAFKYFVNLKNKDGVVPPGALENSFNENVNLMAANQIGMLLAGSNSIGKIFAASPDLKDKIGSVQMPSAKTTFTPVSILGWSLNPDSKHKNAAVKFIKFMSNKQNAMRWAEVTGRMPCTKDATADSKYLQTDLFKGFVAAANAMELTPQAPYYPEVKSILGRTYQKLLSMPSANIEAEVKAAAVEIQKIINNN
ncbi:ABC transporter, solute-binding protein [Treponema socranskii subsp. socranskii VPI DR56BR1116 = ATCC 35536]|uniref:ABC transporter, solute-binding protein n=1 Tax=Treponema socranskii subsp. socranskii VPI DR56BR1116 = ATCC 35536 TaxID=1125725 RepID=U2LIQ8_TRESO|nr:sugar ABC transporter substrate-binding protein [Treponema socranskii]ERF60284.1 ABC transporter, solute-binding protein [Treponema socranskii subsp. socranskii VPI DR56BR1116 = ATCC 35536]ERK04126.1 ABC transporter, solute-binding protein [Treponema socranskii subsp. socranskii VPI DR56BR1116 = ATCC 35536]